MPDEAPTAPEPKQQTFNLKPTETQLLVIISNNHASTFAATLSLIAQERFGYNITEHTQFTLNKELTEIKIQELPPDVPVNPAPADEPKPEVPESGVVSAK